MVSNALDLYSLYSKYYLLYNSNLYSVLICMLYLIYKSNIAATFSRLLKPIPCTDTF